MMKLMDLIKILDEIHPVWLNVHIGGGVIEGELYENSGEIPFRYRDCEVTYLTQDGEKVITLEIENVE